MLINCVVGVLTYENMFGFPALHGIKPQTHTILCLHVSEMVWHDIAKGPYSGVDINENAMGFVVVGTKNLYLEEP